MKQSRKKKLSKKCEKKGIQDNKKININDKIGVFILKH